MKAKKSNFLLLALISTSLIQGQSWAEEFKAKFTAKGEIISVGGQDGIKSEDGLLRLTMPAGISAKVDEKNNAAIYFSGLQKEPSLLSSCISPLPPTEIKLKINPAVESSQEMTILSIGIAELRHNPIKDELSLIVQLNEGYAQVKAPCLKGAVSEVKVNINERGAVLNVNGSEAKLEVPQGKKIRVVQMYPRFGASSKESRLYKGYIYEVELNANTGAIVRP